MKKVIVLVSAIVVLIFSFSQVLAGDYNFNVLNYSEKQQVDRVNSRIILAVDSAGGCSAPLYSEIYLKIETYRDNNSYGSKRYAIYSYMQYLLDTHYNNCIDSVDDIIIGDILSDAEQVSEKKGTFRKFIGGDIEARQNKLYTYFYRGDILINTVKNKINNDKYLIFGKNYNGWHSGEGYLSQYYAKKKLNLYSAHSYYDPDGIKKLEFSKQTDNGTKRYTYNINNSSWE